MRRGEPASPPEVNPFNFSRRAFRYCSVKVVFFLLPRPPPIIASSQCRLQILPAYKLETYPAPAAEEQLNL